MSVALWDLLYLKDHYDKVMSEKRRWLRSIKLMHNNKMPKNDKEWLHIYNMTEDPRYKIVILSMIKNQKLLAHICKKTQFKFIKYCCLRNITDVKIRQELKDFLPSSLLR